MAAVAAVRPRPATVFALVSHILKKGFFLVQGFAIGKNLQVATTTEASTLRL
jgi:hypothetical protein